MAAWRHFLKEWGLVLGLLIVAAGAFLILRTPAGSLHTWDDLEPHLGTGRPVLVEVYSNT